MNLIKPVLIVAIMEIFFLGIAAINAQDASCLPDGSYCNLDSQCCNGWCKSWQCTDPNEPEPSCLPDGSSCSSDSQCCNGWCKSWQCTDPNEPEPSCLPDGSSCGSDSQCCNGWCKSWQCTDPNEPEPSCLPDGSSCGSDSQCCNGWCKSWQCTDPNESPCLPDGSYCNLDSQCCNGWCKSCQCTDPNAPSCLPDGSSCSLDSQCCNGWCKSWRCSSQCEVDSDCPANTPYCYTGGCAAYCVQDVQCDPSRPYCKNGKCTNEQESKIYLIWVGDKDSKNLPGAEVFIDGVSKGITDIKGEIKTEVTSGKHTVSVKADCGEASEEYDFSDDIDGVTLYIDSCPISQCQDIKFQGNVIDMGVFHWDAANGGGAYSTWRVHLTNNSSGPLPRGDPVYVFEGVVYGSDSSLPPELAKGQIDKNIIKGDKVEVYGCYHQDGDSVSLAEKDY